jgi:hypothetical protein
LTHLNYGSIFFMKTSILDERWWEYTLTSIGIILLWIRNYLITDFRSTPWRRTLEENEERRFFIYFRNKSFYFQCFLIIII